MDGLILLFLVTANVEIIYFGYKILKSIDSIFIDERAGTVIRTSNDQIQIHTKGRLINPHGNAIHKMAAQYKNDLGGD